LYLKFNNIWLPVGFHFANNISNDIFEQLSGLKIDNNSFFFTSEGYLDTILLLMAILLTYYMSADKSIHRCKYWIQDGK